MAGVDRDYDAWAKERADRIQEDIAIMRELATSDRMSERERAAAANIIDTMSALVRTVIKIKDAA